MLKLIDTLHGATHRLPGVPAHHDAVETSHAHIAHGRHLQSAHPHPRRRHDAPPRVLVGWQNWIARLVGSDQHGVAPMPPSQGEVPGGAPDSPRYR